MEGSFSAPSNESPKKSEKKSITSRAKEGVRRFLHSRGLPIMIGTASVVGGYQMLEHESQETLKKMKKATESSQSLFSDIPNDKKVDVLYDFQQIILSQGERNHFAHREDGHFPEVLLSKTNREFLKGLTSHFRTYGYQLNSFCDPRHEIKNEEDEIDSKSKTTTALEEFRKRDDVIQDILKTFPKGFKPDFDFLPFRDYKILDNKNLVGGLKRAAELRYSIGYFDQEGIENFLKDTTRQKLFQQISSYSINLESTLASSSIESLQQFISKEKPLIESLAGSTIDKEIVEIFTDSNLASTAKEWKSILANPIMRKNIHVLESHGYTLADIFSLSAPFVKSLLSNNESVKAVVDFSESVGDVGGLQFLGGHGYYSVSNYVDITNPEGLKKFNEIVSSVKNQKNNITAGDILEKAQQVVLGNRLNSLIEMYPQDQVHFSELAGDRSLQMMIKLGYDKKVPKELEGLSYRNQTEWVVRTCRNMYQLGVDPTPEHFLQYYKKGVELRSDPKISGIQLFTGRDVAFFAHNEILPDEIKSEIPDTFDMKRFGNDATIEAMKKQHPHSCKVFRASQDLHDIKELKNNFLSFIQNMDKATLFIDAHGSPDGFTFSNNVSKDTTLSLPEDQRLNTLDFCKALIERSKRGHKDPLIIISIACHNQDFIRNLARELDEYNRDSSKNVPMPIFVGTTEYGQYSFSEFHNKYRDVFTDALLNSFGKKPVTLGDVFKIEENPGTYKLRNNISIFVPFIGTDGKGNKKEIPFQIAKTKESQIKEEIFARMYEHSVKQGVYDDKRTASYYDAVSPEKAKEIRDSIEELPT